MNVEDLSHQENLFNTKRIPSHNNFMVGFLNSLILNVLLSIQEPVIVIHLKSLLLN